MLSAQNGIRNENALGSFDFVTALLLPDGRPTQPSDVLRASFHSAAAETAPTAALPRRRARGERFVRSNNGAWLARLTKF
jgi:hypothetical protein